MESFAESIPSVILALTDQYDILYLMTDLHRLTHTTDPREDLSVWKAHRANWRVPNFSIIGAVD